MGAREGTNDRADRSAEDNYVDEAERLAKLFWEKAPKYKATFKPKYFSYYPYNPWEDRAENLHCIFMAGHLQPQRPRTILQDRKEAGEHLLDEEYWKDPY